MAVLRDGVRPFRPRFCLRCVRFAISECALCLAVSALTGNILVRMIPILVFRALTRQSWFDKAVGIPVESQLGNGWRKIITQR